MKKPVGPAPQNAPINRCDLLASAYTPTRTQSSQQKAPPHTNAEAGDPRRRPSAASLLREKPARPAARRQDRIHVSREGHRQEQAREVHPEILRRPHEEAGPGLEAHTALPGGMEQT